MRFLALVLLASSCGLAAEVALTVGVHNNSTAKVQNGNQTVEASSSSGVLITPAGSIVNIGGASLGWEVPVAFGGPGRAFFALGAVATEKIDFMFVPGARLRLAPGSRFSPWVSVGAGAGRFSRASTASSGNALQAITSTDFTIGIGAGLDVKVAGPLFLRVEGRDFNFKGVDQLRRNSFQIFAGAGLRF